MRTVVFINTHSRQARQSVTSVKNHFNKQKKFDVIDFIVVEDLAKFDEYIRQLQSHKKLECVIVGSGDGTIIAALNALKNRKRIIYGFLPLGTSNVFVRSLGIPTDIRAALAILGKAKPKRVSLGSINGHLFANSAGIGIPAEVVGKLTNRAKKIFGPLAYIISGLQHFISHHAYECSISVDGHKGQTFQTHHLLIANGAYHGTFKVGNGASVFSDELVITIFGTSKRRWDYVVTILTFGIIKREHQKTLVLHGKKVLIDTKPVRNIEADGENITKTPVEVACIKNAISVLLP